VKGDNRLLFVHFELIHPPGSSSQQELPSQCFTSKGGVIFSRKSVGDFARKLKSGGPSDPDDLPQHRVHSSKDVATA